jgi:hypothetical protein
MDARFIGTGTLQLTDAPGAEWNGWIEKSMDFQGTAFLSPEPGTFTLLGIAGIASIVGILFRRRYSNA